jgi:hypothetical protein
MSNDIYNNRKDLRIPNSSTREEGEVKDKKIVLTRRVLAP